MLKVATATAALLWATVATSNARCSQSSFPPSVTIAGMLARTDEAVLVHWAGGTKPTDTSTGETVYEIRQIVKNHPRPHKKGERSVLSGYREGKVDDLFLLVGNMSLSGGWHAPLEITETFFKYAIQAPVPETSTSKRLEYYFKFLEHPDQMISNDAYLEFKHAPTADIVQMSKQLPPEKIRRWITHPQTPVTRMGVYGLLIGLCGTEEDSKILEQKILEGTEEFRHGQPGLMPGYLLLRGEEGLSILDKHVLMNPDVSFGKVYAAKEAMRFMWSRSEGRIGKSRLRQSMRILLERPELADLVIADLARWKDWTIQNRLMDIYVSSLTRIPVTAENAEELRDLKRRASRLIDGKFSLTLNERTSNAYSIYSIKRAIVRYMLICSKDMTEESTNGTDTAVPEHVTSALSYLKILQELDPKTVTRAQRFFFIK